MSDWGCLAKFLYFRRSVDFCIASGVVVASINQKLVMASLLLAYVASALGACCGPGEFCGGDGKTCFENSCDNLLQHACGVPTCCSCQTSSIVTPTGLCTYQHCSDANAFCLQVTEIAGGTLLSDRERKSIVSCNGSFVLNITAACDQIHKPGDDHVLVGYDSTCDPRWHSAECE